MGRSSLAVILALALTATTVDSASAFWFFGFFRHHHRYHHHRHYHYHYHRHVHKYHWRGGAARPPRRQTDDPETREDLGNVGQKLDEITRQLREPPR